MRGIGSKICRKMLNIKILFFVILSPIVLRAQYDGEGDLKSRHRPGIMWYLTGMKPAATGKPRKYDRLMVDLNYNTYMDSASVRWVNWKSLGTNVHTMMEVPLVSKNVFSFAFGITYGFQSINLNPSLISDSSNSYTLWDQSLHLYNYKARKYNQHQFSIPIEFRLRTKGWKHVKVHLGSRFGYRFKSYQKDVYFENNHRKVDRYKGVYDQNQLFVSSYIRIGLRNISLYAEYHWLNEFNHSKSIVLKPINLGITFSLF